MDRGEAWWRWSSGNFRGVTVGGVHWLHHGTTYEVTTVDDMSVYSFYKLAVSVNNFPIAVYSLETGYLAAWALITWRMEVQVSRICFQCMVDRTWREVRSFSWGRLHPSHRWVIQSVVRLFSDTGEIEATLEDRRFILQDEIFWSKWTNGIYRWVAVLIDKSDSKSDAELI